MSFYPLSTASDAAILDWLGRAHSRDFDLLLAFLQPLCDWPDRCADGIRPDRHGGLPIHVARIPNTDAWVMYVYADRPEPFLEILRIWTPIGPESPPSG